MNLSISHETFSLMHIVNFGKNQGGILISAASLHVNFIPLNIIRPQLQPNLT
jgi:hypothetical protein